ncbi:hypothetical protein UlMin_028433 [Ulmus minor]
MKTIANFIHDMLMGKRPIKSIPHLVKGHGLRTEWRNRQRLCNRPASPPWARYFPSFLWECWARVKQICGGGIAMYEVFFPSLTNTCFMMYYFLYTVSTYLKPHVMANYIYNMHVFANPETLIGFHPDVRASFYLLRLPGHLEKLSGEEMVACGCGVATHYSHSSRLQSIEEQLRKLVTDDPFMLETTLGKYGEVIYPKKGVLSRIEMIDKCFSNDTVEEIIEARAARTCDDWCTSTLRRLKEFRYIPSGDEEEAKAKKYEERAKRLEALTIKYYCLLGALTQSYQVQLKTLIREKI